MNNLNSNPERTIIKRAQSRFIQIDEQCIENLGLYAMAVYQRLRLISDFTKDFDEVEITVKNLARDCRISERKTYDALNELEHEHYLIQRLNYHHIRFGKVNAYNVARDYNFFQPAQNLSQPAPHADPVDKSVQKSSHTAPHAEGTAPHADTPAPNADLIINNSFQNSFHKKTVNKGKPPVNCSVFSDSCSIKTHIEMVIARRGHEVEEDIINQIVYYIGDARKFDLVNKKTNIALKLVREGKWNIPNGYNGITYQGIKEKEEQEQQNKREQYQQEAQAYRNVVQEVAKKGEPNQDWKNLVASMGIKRVNG